MSSKAGDWWYAATISVVGGTLLYGALHAAGTHLSTLVEPRIDPSTWPGLTSVVLLGLVWLTLVFLGPRRASLAQLTWRRQQAQSRHAPLISALLVALGLSLILTLALSMFAEWGLGGAAILQVLLEVGVGSALLFLLALVVQRFGSPNSTRWLTMGFLGANALTLLLPALGFEAGLARALELAPPVVAAGICLGLAAPRLRERNRRTPRWELIRADANLGSLHTSIFLLDSNAISALIDQRGTPSRRPSWPPPTARAASLFLLLAERTGAAGCWWVVGVLASTWVASLAGGPSLGGLVALAGTLALTLKVGKAWNTWCTSPSLRRTMAVIAGPKTTALFLGLWILPALVGVGSVWLSAFPNSFPFDRAAVVVLASAYLLVERGRALARVQQQGPLGTVVHVPELGQVSLGLVTRSTSGWLVAAVVGLLGLVFAPAPAALALGVLFAVSAFRVWYDQNR